MEEKTKESRCLLSRFVAAVIPILIVAAGLTGCASRGAKWNIQNPYAGIDWAKYQQHKANFHTHTTLSDGSGTPQEVIDRYHALGYTILALTDHDTMGTGRTTWPWQAFDRDPKTLGMVAIEGSEISRVHHIGSYFNDYGDVGVDSENAVIKEIGRRGGLAVMFHPGRYWKPVEWYVEMYRAYPQLIGFEIYNQGDRYPNDRKTWDAILTDIVTERPVWGFSNDDMHNPGTQLGHNWNVMLLPELEVEWVRRGMENGAFFFVYAPDDHNGALLPVIKSITVDLQKGVINIDATGYEKIEWISQGVIVHRGDRVNLSELSNLGGYIRAEIRGANSGSIVGTQPFRIQTPAK
jgi:hypothetical protein